MFTPFLDALARGALVLTVNRRLARFLSGIHDRHRTAAGATAWPTPYILPYTAWLEQTWEAVLDQARLAPSLPDSSPVAADAPPVLLTPWQEKALWERIIADSPEGGRLLRVAGAAEQAWEAWSLLRQWRLRLPPAETIGHEDAGAFLGWSQRFAALLRENNWLDGAGLAEYLIAHPRYLTPAVSGEPPDHAPLPGGEVLLCGFERQTPLQAALFQSLRELGVRVADADMAAAPGAMERVACADREAELRSAACWARMWMERLPGGDRPRIGVVIPDLDRRRAEVVRVFLETFHPGAEPWAMSPESPAFNLSLGAPLGETPLVRDALLLLGLGAGYGDAESWSRLLGSPFWAGGRSEWTRRGRLDAHLRHLGNGAFTLAEMVRLAAGVGQESPACPLLRVTLEGFMAGVAAPGTPGTGGEPDGPAGWAGRFSTWLTRLGWPGESPLSSGEYQIVEAWRDLLITFSALERVHDRLSPGQALALLTRMTAETPFQPRSGEAPVQVLGMLEAVGERFDALWILGLSDDVWPPDPRPNPFLPIGFQRRHDLPRASRERELDHAHALFTQLLGASPRVIVSHPQREGDRELQPGALIAGLPLAAADDPDVHPPVPPLYADLIRSSAALERVTTEPGLPFPAGVPVVVGTGVLKAQSLCPFQAFARYRLGAEALAERQPGLDPIRRGQIVHQALALVWGEVDSSAALAGLDATDRSGLVERLVRRALSWAAQQWPDRLPRRFRQLEQGRLERLLGDWLELEAGRDAPFRVIEREQPGQLDLDGVTVRYRLDRVDRLETGGVVILDYKTGRPKVTDWFGERPREPQMPLYALARSGEVAALAYGRVRGGEQGFTGLSRSGEPLPGVAEPKDRTDGDGDPGQEAWPAMERQWRRTLTALADGYRGGVAAVDPLPMACNHCDLPPLCRIFERGPDVAEVESDDD